MSDSGDSNLTPPQDRAIIALLSEPNIRKVAEAVGVDERTIYRWLEEPAFAAAHRRAKSLAFRQGVALLQKYVPLAVQTLAKVAADASAPHSSKVSAASAMLKHARDSMELDDLAARVEAIERATQGSKR